MCIGMDSVYVMQKIYPYEGRRIIGIYSSMKNAKETIRPVIEKDNVEQFMGAAFYRWKKLVKDENLYVSSRFYQFRNKWVLIKDTSDEMTWVEPYSYISIQQYELNKPTVFFPNI